MSQHIRKNMALTVPGDGFDQPVTYRGSTVYVGDSDAVVVPEAYERALAEELARQFTTETFARTYDGVYETGVVVIDAGDGNRRFDVTVKLTEIPQESSYTIQSIVEHPHDGSDASLPITVMAVVTGAPDVVWDYFTKPEHITKWNAASDDWHSPRATNDLREGGTFSVRMEAKDGSEGFDFEGTYIAVRQLESYEYRMSDGRTVTVRFVSLDHSQTRIIETFDPEHENTIEMQRAGWQSILNNFKRYVEAV